MSLTGRQLRRVTVRSLDKNPCDADTCDKKSREEAPMNTYLAEELVHDRIAELRGSATRHAAGSRSTRHAPPGRERVGWMLVTVGLRLVGDERHRSAHGIG